MTKKPFRARFARTKSRKSGSFFRALPKRINRFSFFREQSEQKLFCHVMKSSCYFCYALFFATLERRVKRFFGELSCCF